MSDVRRCLKVFALCGCLECLFLQEISGAKADEEANVFGRDNSVLLNQSGQPHVHAQTADRDLAGDRDHSVDTQPKERPVLRGPAILFPSEPSRQMDSFPAPGALSGKQSKVKVFGKVEIARGNFQPGRDDKMGQVETGETRLVFLNKKIKAMDKGERIAIPNLEDVSRQEGTTIVLSDKTGDYRVSLAPGNYTVFIEKNGKLYPNKFAAMDREGYFDTIEVKSQESQKIDLSETSEALY